MFKRSKSKPFPGVSKRVCRYETGRKLPTEIATTLNYILFDEFRKSSLNPTFVGQYIVDSENPSQTRVFCHQGTEACSPIPISRGVIGRAVRTGRNQYVPDVTRDSEHVGCDPAMEGSELVLIAWSKPYSEKNPFAGESVRKRVPLGVLDIDLNVKTL